MAADKNEIEVNAYTFAAALADHLDEEAAAYEGEGLDSAGRDLRHATRELRAMRRDQLDGFYLVGTTGDRPEKYARILADRVRELGFEKTADIIGSAASAGNTDGLAHPRYNLGI